MALVLADRVRETTTTNGTGTVTLLGAVSGYQSFSVVGNSNTTYYCIASQSASEWEVGIGTYTASGTTLSRDTILASSNSGAAVPFTSGTKDVFVTYPAGKSVNYNAAGNVALTGGLTLGSALPVASGGTGQTSYTDGQLLIGNSSGNTLTKATLTQGSGVTITNGNGTITIAATGLGGDVVGPASATDNAVVRFDGTTGKLVQNSAVTIADDGTTVISTNSSTDALRITQTGAGNALLVEDSANPDSTPFVIDASGNVGIGTTAPTVPLQIYNATSTVVNINGDSTTQLALQRYSNDGNGPAIALRKYRGSFASPAAASSGDISGGVNFLAYGGTNSRQVAAITGYVDTYTSDTNLSGYLLFQTNPGGTGVTERMRIDSAGQVGIGAAPPNGYSLLVGKAIQGSAFSYGIASTGTTQSGVTSGTTSFYSITRTAAASFSTYAYNYYADQDILGAGSSLLGQYGFYAASSLTSATNNFGFYSNIASGTGRWNFYANGTADNYFAGRVGVGITPNSAYSLDVGRNITGSVTSYGLMSEGVVQSDVTANAIYYGTSANTAASSFTVSAIRHFNAFQGTFGLGSTVTSQYGFLADSSLTGATNNYGFWSNIASGTGRWNFFANGTADNYFAGKVGIGATPNTGYKLDVGGSGDSIGRFLAAGQSSGLEIGQLTADGGNKVFVANNNYLIFGTNNTERMRITSSGNIGIGDAGNLDTILKIGTSTTTSVYGTGIFLVPIVPSNHTDSYDFFRSFARTAAASFTLGNLRHFFAEQSTFGASSAVTNQFGFAVSASLTSATNNYGFYSAIASGTGRWNFYAAGTANNAFAGSSSFGTTSAPTALITIAAGTATANTAPLKFTSGTNLSTPEAGVVEYDGTVMTATSNTNFKRGTVPITNYASGVGTSLTATAEATLQVLLPSANDTITLSVGTYFLDLCCTFTRGTTSTTSATARINILGTGNAVGSFSGMAISSATAASASSNFSFDAVNINTSNVVTAASTTASGVYTITLRGILKITTQGTIIPQYNLSANLTSAGTATAPKVLYLNLTQLDTQSAAAFGPAGTGWA